MTQRKVLVIGIGAGNPDYVTMQAVDALNRADVFFIPDKGAEKHDLADLRREICDRFIRAPTYRTIDFAVPQRRQGEQPTESPDQDRYVAEVARWHDNVERVYEDLLADQLGAEECGAFLVWGDPSLYDSTIRILDRIAARGRLALDVEVIPGISAVQALAARHRVTLNAVGQSVLLSTGRQMADGLPDQPDSIVLMLDNAAGLRAADSELDVYWGAYLGTPDEILIAGRLGDVIGEIERARIEARQEKGWIFETSLLRRTRDG